LSIEARERAAIRRSARLASLIISAAIGPRRRALPAGLGRPRRSMSGSRYWGLPKAPLAVIKGRYRFRLLVKSLRNVDLSEYFARMAGGRPKTKGNLKLEIDVDPQSFL